jgi:hypothetical protein
MAVSCEREKNGAAWLERNGDFPLKGRKFPSHDSGHCLRFVLTLDSRIKSQFIWIQCFGSILSQKYEMWLFQKSVMRSNTRAPLKLKWINIKISWMFWCDKNNKTAEFSRFDKIFFNQLIFLPRKKSTNQLNFQEFFPTLLKYVTFSQRFGLTKITIQGNCQDLTRILKNQMIYLIRQKSQISWRVLTAQICEQFGTFWKTILATLAESVSW